MASSQRYMSKADAARHFGVSAALITRKKQQGKLTMRGDQVDIVKSAPAFEDQQQNQPPLESFAAAQARKETALANLRELEHRQKSGDLVDVTEMQKAWATAGMTMRDGLLSLPERIAPHVAAVTDPRQVRDILRSEIRTIIENLPDKIRNAESEAEPAD